MTDEHAPEHIVDERDAARYLNFTPAFMRRRREVGGGPAYLRIGRTIRYRIADLDAWLAAHRIDPSDRPSPNRRESPAAPAARP